MAPLASSVSNITTRPMDFSPRQQQKTLAQLYNTQPNLPPPPYNMAAPFSSNSIMNNPPDHVFDDDEEDEYPEPLSKICITIRAPVIINGNTNAVSVDPASTGSKVAVAIVSGLRQMSGAGGGVPMIDEHGRPRPIIVDVDATMRVDGSDNIVGERALFANLNAAAQGNAADANGAKKREREDSSPPDEDDNSKRPKTE